MTHNPDPPLAQHRPAPVAPDPCRDGAGRRRRADQRADDDQHADHRRRRRRSRRCSACAEAGRRHRAGLLPGRGIDAGAARDRAREPGADRRRHPFPLQTRDRGGRGGAACLRINPGNIGSAGAGARGDQGGQGPRLLDADRRQCRLARAAPAGEIRRALPGGDGRERARPYPHPRGQRLPRVQDQREGVRRVPRGRRLSGSWPRRPTRRSISGSPRRAG